MTDNGPTIFLSAAEASGDHHAANLIRAIRRQAPGARFVGAAGPKMAAQRCEVVADLTAQASMVGGPFLKLRYYHRKVKELQAAIARAKPGVVVPVDSPALNWHLAAAARKLNIPVVYYIAPQVWAWAPWRVKKLARLTTAVACILPFEEEYLRSRGVNATYVGHPLMDDLAPRAEHPDLGEAWANGTWRVALVPGSRPGEIRAHTPALLRLAEDIQRRWPKAQCVFTAHDEIAAETIRACAKGQSVQVATGQTRDVLASCHFGVVKSGTVTLEAAYLGLPMVILYRTGLLMGALRRTIGRCRAMMPTKYLSLVNILARRRLVDELMPWHGSYRKLQSAVLRDMEDLGYLCDLRRDLMALTSPLKSTAAPAADNAAKLVLEHAG